MGGEIGLAFLAGLLSFLAPCCLPMVPIYLSYVAGLAGQGEDGAIRPARRLVVGHTLWFIAGFALVFVALGASASVLGQVVRAHLAEVRHIAGVAIVAFGLQQAGLLRLPWLSRDWRLSLQPKPGTSRARSGLLGIAFAAGWSPCVGPMLGSILLLSSTSGTLSRGVILLLAYALGLGLPFLGAAAALGSLRRIVQGLRRYNRAFAWFSGAVLVAMRLMVFAGTFGQLARVVPLGF